MTQQIRPGRPIWLELNAQRVQAGIAFYETVFGWWSRPLHVPPWGAMPNIVNRKRLFGNQFMAMGSFAAPRWNLWFSGDLEKAEKAIIAGGGDVGQGIHRLGDLGLLLNALDNRGYPFALIALDQDVPAHDQYGDPCMAEFWGPGAIDAADFYAAALDLQAVPTDTGIMLRDRSTPRLFLRNSDVDIHPPRWIPYFRSSSVGGDTERARRAGGIIQVHPEVIPHMGELVVMSDPAGAFFGLVDTNVS
ncbi:hypothetical protein [Yoonia sp. R2-816]|uniref:hypothetical protein n=1 Tax=Yoonia sp. R2-816 TaxID=3342638 RepID=UPI003726C6D0